MKAYIQHDIRFVTVVAWARFDGSYLAFLHTTLGPRIQHDLLKSRNAFECALIMDGCMMLHVTYLPRPMNFP